MTRFVDPTDEPAVALHPSPITAQAADQAAVRRSDLALVLRHLGVRTRESEPVDSA